MPNTLVAVYDDLSHARQAEKDLLANGFAQDEIRIVSQSAQTTTGTSTGTYGGSHETFWDSVKDFFGFSDESDRTTYREATRHGSHILTVRTDEQRLDTAAAIMQRYNPVDVKTRQQQWGAGAAATTQATTQARGTQKTAGTTSRAQGKEAIPVVEEQVQIGKRAVERGGVRIYSHVTEKPVHEQVKLREEQVNVERRPADRPVTDADQAFKDRKIEVTERREEPVVSKQARVVEEVVVNKDVRERTQDVRETARRTDVEVEKIDPNLTDERYRPAYDYAREVAGDKRYHGREFDDIEMDVRTNFERRHPDRRWDEHRDAVRRGYNRYRMQT